MQSVVIVIHLMIVMIMVGLVLLQRSEGGGLGMGGGGFMSSRGTANMLTRATAFLAAAFFVTSLVLSILAGYGRKPSSILGTDAPPAPTSPSAPAPIGQGGGGLLDQLRGGGQQPAAPPAGSAPSAPQVPRSQ